MTTAPPAIFDRRLVRWRLARAAAAGAEEFLIFHACDEFCERLSSIKRKFSAVFDAGTPSPWLAARLADRLKPRLLVRMTPLAQTAGDGSLLR
ncbi:MAG: SAM-dependent methyltransferase, partial [Acidimicrobiales bacterium]